MKAMNRTRTVIRVCGVLIGVAVAGGALAYEHDPVLSKNPAIALVQWSAVYLSLPGIGIGFIVSGAGRVLGANMHAYSMRVVEVASFFFYATAGWLISLLFARAKRSKTPD